MRAEGDKRSWKMELRLDLPAVRKISPYYQWDFLLSEFFDGDLERIGLAFQIDEDGGVHATST